MTRRLRKWQRIFLPLLLAVAIGGAWWIHSRIRQNQLRTLIQTCRDAVHREDWRAAAPLAEEWAARTPEDGDAWIILADIAKAQGDFESLAECLRRVPVSDSRYVKSQLLRADLLLNGMNRPYEAVNAWRSVLAVDPYHPTPHQRILYIYSMTLQREKLARQIRDSIRARAEPPEAYGYLLSIPNLMFTDGYVRVEKWLEASPDDESLQVAYAIFLERSNSSGSVREFGAGKEKKKTTPFEAASKKYPRNLEIKAIEINDIIARADMAALGEALQDLPPEAERDSRFWRFIATYQDSQQQHQEAAASLQKALELHPMDWKAHHELATIERVLGRTKESARHADLGARGKVIERRVFELANAAQADPPLLRAILRYARDCGDTDVVDGLTERLEDMNELEGPES